MKEIAYSGWLTITRSHEVQMNPTFTLERRSPITGNWTLIDARVSVTEAAFQVRDLDIPQDAVDRACLELTRHDIDSLNILDEDGASYMLARNAR